MVSEAGSQYESQRAAITSIAVMTGCTLETLRRWVRQQERDTRRRPEPTSTEEERVKALVRELRELRKANQTLRLASAFSPKRSSAATSSREGVHRLVSSCLRGRADLQGDAGRTVGLLAPRCAAAQPGTALCPCSARRRAERRH